MLIEEQNQNLGCLVVALYSLQNKLVRITTILPMSVLDKDFIHIKIVATVIRLLRADRDFVIHNQRSFLASLPQQVRSTYVLQVKYFDMEEQKAIISAGGLA
jgi:hypothetical protein